MAERILTITPAAPALDAAGTPYSPEYGDVYHSADSGPGQARHVFLGGNDLPARWARARVYTILETGFGLGLNFLATWQAWRDDSEHCARLHYVSIEKSPFTREGLVLLHARYPEFSGLAGELQEHWPHLTPGLHRIEFERGGITLTLALGNVEQLARELRLTADACYLDGFAPARNPEMWSGGVARALARLSHPGTTLATYTTARAVREALSAAGFACELRPGFGRKRQMLCARYAPRWRIRPPAAPRVEWPERSALVIGAGLAGAAVAERLSAHGWRVDLVERRAAAATEASGLPAGVFHPLVARDDSVLARLTRTGYARALARWRTLADAGHTLVWRRCGVLQLARDAREAARMQEAAAGLRLPVSYAEYVSAAEGSARAGRPVNAGGLWFAGGGWMRPASLVAAQLEAAASSGAGLRTHFGREALRLAHDGARWTAVARDGAAIASAAVCVLAGSHGSARLADFGDHNLKRVRGQVTCLPAGSCGALTSVLAGTAYLAPVADGLVAGATYDLDDTDAAPRAADHAENLERIAEFLPDPPRLDVATLAGAVGFRCVTRDRMPMIGPVPDVAAARARHVELSGAQLRDLPRRRGLYAAFAYASRGLIWAALGAEIIACMLEAEPSPLEGRLADAMDPGRFVLQGLRHGSL